MSRIHDILARAGRDGTARRLPSSSDTPDAGRAAIALHVPADGAERPDQEPFVHDPVPGSPVSATHAQRTAQATLHPALVAAIAPHSRVAEQYRAIRTRLMLREESGPLRTIAVTSPHHGDGKSITAANMALTMAQVLQRSVVLIDADLRTPAVHSLFAVERGPGLTEVLTGEATLDEALIHLPDLRLTLITAGQVPEYPTELLGSVPMRRLLDVLRTQFDRVLIDLPAVMPFADVGTVAPLVDGAVMVVRAGVTQRPALDRALSVFDDDKVLGVVLNDLD